MTPRRLAFLFPYLALALLFFAFHREVYFQGKVYANPWIFRNHSPFPKPDPASLNPLNTGTEYMTHYFPYKKFLADCLRERELPLWNPSVFCGFPQYANANTCVFSPFNLLLLRWPPYRAYLALLAAFFLSGSFLLYFYLARFAKASAPAAFAGAASLLFAPHLMEFIDFDTTLALVWVFPLVLIMAHRLAESRRGAVETAFVFLAAIVMGHMHVVVNALILFTLYFLYIARNLPLYSRFLRLLAVYAWFGALALFILWPTALSFRQSHWLPELAAGTPELRWPVSFVTGLYPALTKIPLFHKFLSEAMGGHASFSVTVSVGTLPFLLGLAGCAAVFFKSTNRTLRFFAAWVLAYHVWDVLGFTQWVPGAAGQFLNVCFFKFWQFYVFASAVVTALALDAIGLKGAYRTALGWIQKSFGVLIVLPMTAAGIAVWYYREPLRTRLWLELMQRGLMAENAYYHGRFAEIFNTALTVLNPLSPWMIVPALAVVGIGWALRRPSKAPHELLVFLVVLELVWTGRQVLPKPQPDSAVWPQTEVTDFLKKDPALFRVMALQTTGKPGEGVQKYILKPNLGIPYGLYDVGGMDSMTIGSYLYFTQKYLTGRPEAPFSRYGQLDFEFVDPAVAGFLNVKYILVSDARKLEEKGLEPVLTADGLTVYENKKFLPRIFFTRKVRPFADFDGVYRSLSGDPFDGEPWVYTSGPVGEPSGEGIFGRAPEPVISRFSRQDVRLDIETAQPGMLVFTDSFDDGWKAYDGETPVSIERINGLFKGVPLQPGAHAIRFEYYPDAFYRGLVVSAAALLALVLFWIVLK